jgi:ubiquinone/menaquinone biosynthesis C-methylase UbiE
MIPVPRKRTGPEFLDLPDSYGVEELEDSLADIRIVNRYLGDRHALIKHLSAQIGGASEFTLLDIATGSADLLITIAEWARKRGKAATLMGIDINEQTVAVARAQTEGYPEITVQVADGLDLPFADHSFDFVVCSKTAHHFEENDGIRLIREMRRVARRGFLLMDLRRSWIAYFLIRLLTRIFTRNRLTRADGPLSVLKSFTPEELAALAAKSGASHFTVSKEPFWLLVLSGEAG